MSGFNKQNSKEFTSITIVDKQPSADDTVDKNTSGESLSTPFFGFPTSPYSIDDLLQKQTFSKKTRKKHPSYPQSEPSSKKLAPSKSEPTINDGVAGLYRRSSIHFHGHMKQIRENIKNIDGRKVMKTLAPTKIPIVQRFIKWAREKWPGSPGQKWILYSPYFFLYIISLALVQATMAGFSIDNYEIVYGFQVSTLVSVAFFILYVFEVCFRIYVKGFDFFLQIYNIAEVSLTFTAFILDFQLTGTSFVANVLSLRIIWCIHKVPGMDFVFEGLKKAFPRISIILFPFLILTYVFAVIATSTLGPSSYEYPSIDYWKEKYRYKLQNGTTITVKGAGLDYDYFGTIPLSMFTLFQVMTGDAWADSIARPTMKNRPGSLLLFITFYSLFAFIFLNIFTGIMVDAIQSFEKERREREKAGKVLKQWKRAKISKKTTVPNTRSRYSEASSSDAESDINGSGENGIIKTAVMDDSLDTVETKTSANKNNPESIDPKMFQMLFNELKGLKTELTGLKTRLDESSRE